MARFITSMAIALSLVVLGPGHLLAKGPSGGRSSGGMQGGSMQGGSMQGGSMQGGSMQGGSMQGGGMQGDSMQGGSQGNKSWNQGSNQNWNQDTNKSGNQNMNTGKSWNQDSNRSFSHDMNKSSNLQTFDSKHHPEFSGGPGSHDDWRFRFENGRWWFWAPGDRWAWYDNGRWNNYGYNDYGYNDAYVVERPIQENFSGELIKIINPPSSKAPLSYSLNGRTYTIQPGYSQDLREDRAWVIQFSRGADMGQVQYGLSPGIYKFARTNHGWELYRSDLAQPSAPASPAPMSPTPMNAPTQ